MLYVGLLPLSTVLAQQVANDSTLNRTVVVENQYNPEVMDAFKVNVLPKIEEPQVPKKQIDYAVGQHPLANWKGADMSPIAAGETQPAASRGYIRGAYGNRNNTDFRLSYLWDISRKDQLGVMGSIYGRDGKLSSLSDSYDWNSRFFRADASVDYRHSFDKVAFALGGNIGSQNLNYMPQDETISSEHQRFLMGEGYMQLLSAKDAFPVDFSLQTGVQLFSRKHNQANQFASSETKVHTQGHVTGVMDERQKITLALTLDNVFYSEKNEAGNQLPVGTSETNPSILNSPLENLSLLQLTPYYTYVHDAISLKLGAHVDWQFGYDNGLKVAPQIAADYTFSDSYTLYLHADGGTQLNDYRRLNDVSPYFWNAFQPTTTYTPLEAEVGFVASPLAGLGIRIYGGYKLTKDDLLITPTYYGLTQNYVALVQEKTKAAFGGAKIDYNCKGWIDLSLGGTYYNWSTNENDNETLLWLKPEFALEFSLRAKILSELHAGVNYHYESRIQPEGVDEKANPVNNLGLYAEYQLLGRASIFVQFHNLLGKNYITEQGYPEQGFHALAGISWRF